jgi:hypothetical protein
MQKLPVIDAIKHSIRSTINNFPFAFHVSWPWMAVLLPLNIIASLYGLTHEFNPEKPDMAELATAGPFLILMVLVSFISYSAIAVSWHRYILLDEVPQGWARLRLDGPMWRYLGNIILIVLAMALIAVPVVIAVGVLGAILVAGMGSSGIAVAAALGIAAYAFIAVAGYRFSIKLPAVALNERQFTLADAWNCSRGNFWQLLGLGLIYLVIAVAFGLLIFAVSDVLGLVGSAGAAVAVAIQVVVNWVLTILGVTILTSLYGFFVEGREL